MNTRIRMERFQHHHRPTGTSRTSGSTGTSKTSGTSSNETVDPVEPLEPVGGAAVVLEVKTERRKVATSRPQTSSAAQNETLK